MRSIQSDFKGNNLISFMEEARNRFCSNQEFLYLYFFVYVWIFFRFWCSLNCVCKPLLCWLYAVRGAPPQLTCKLVLFKLYLFLYVHRSKTNSYIYVLYLKSECMHVSYNKPIEIAFFSMSCRLYIKKMHSLHYFFSHFIIVLWFAGIYRYFFLNSSYN